MADAQDQRQSAAAATSESKATLAQQSSAETSTDPVDEVQLDMAINEDNTEGSDDRKNNDLENSSGNSLSFNETLLEFQKGLDADFRQFEVDLESKTAKDTELPSYEWEQLEHDYQNEIGPLAMKEREIFEQFDERFKQFMLWMQVSNERESNRAIKRLKTQSALVRNSEFELEKQEEHYARVMEAFQSAMTLLSHRS